MLWASLMTQWQRIHLAVQETRVQALGWEDPLEEETATHSSILAWRIPWTEEPGGLQSTGLQSRTRLKRLSMHTYTSMCVFVCKCVPCTLIYFVKQANTPTLIQLPILLRSRCYQHTEPCTPVHTQERHVPPSGGLHS